jgi:hypothetical protein
VTLVDYKCFSIFFFHLHCHFLIGLWFLAILAESRKKHKVDDTGCGVVLDEVLHQQYARLVDLQLRLGGGGEGLDAGREKIEAIREGVHGSALELVQQRGLAHPVHAARAGRARSAQTERARRKLNRGIPCSEF